MGGCGPLSDHAAEVTTAFTGRLRLEGYCIDSSIAYGPMLPLETRKDIAARVVHTVSRVQEDRHAVANAKNGLIEDLPAIASSADTPIAFYRPLAALFASTARS